MPEKMEFFKSSQKKFQQELLLSVLNRSNSENEDL